MRRVLGIDPVPAHVRQRQAVGPEGADVGIDEAEQVHAARLLAAASENLFAEADAEHGLRRLADEVRKAALLDGGHRGSGRRAGRCGRRRGSRPPRA